MRQAARADERVAAEALHVDRTGRDAREVGVAADVVEVVDGEHARQERLEDPDPAGHRRVGQGGLRHEEGDPAGVDRLARGEAITGGDAARRPAEGGDRPAELALDDELAEVLVGKPLVARPADVVRGGEGMQDVVVEEVGERTVPDVVEEARHAECLDDEPFRRQVVVGHSLRAELDDERGMEVAGPQAGLVHHPEAVGEAGVLGRREDPAGALELRDPAHPLEPGRVEEILFRGGLGRQAGLGRLGVPESLGQLDVAVDRVADEVDGGERVAAHHSTGRDRRARWMSARAPTRGAVMSTPRHCPPSRGLAPEASSSDLGSCSSG